MKRMRVMVSVERRDSRFKVPVLFTLIPPKTLDYEGNGYYMDVDMPGASHYVDVRYSGTIRLEKLARFWLIKYFGHTLRDIQVLETV